MFVIKHRPPSAKTVKYFVHRLHTVPHGHMGSFMQRATFHGVR